MIDRFLLKFFGGMDWISEKIDSLLFAPKCKCKKKKKNEKG
jgi:hypothetical protein